ncbi:hypothetical protein XPA_010436 [Xanthoria parietina]
MDASDGILVFAKLIPHGSEAEDALDTLCNSEDLDPRHRSFIHYEPGPRNRPQDSSSDSGHPSRPPQHTSTGQSYDLSLHKPPHQPFSRGWVLGRDPAEVDLLLIRPGKGRKHVASVHARIRMHCISGVLMLVSADDERPVVYRPYHSPHPIYLRNGQSHVLFGQSNSFSIGCLHYTLVFTDLSPEQYKSFVKQRNDLMRDYSLVIPHPRLSAVPQQAHVKRGAYVLHGTFASGTFGFVAAAVVANTGVPVAVKEHRARHLSE